MRILYLTQWFEPEPNIIKGLPFVRALQAQGHEVTVVTGFPNYPTGKIYPGYRLAWRRREVVEGVEILRLPLYPSHDRSSLRRSLNYLSFFASVLGFLLLRRRRYDLAYVYHPPITVGLAAALAGMLRPLPFILDVQDLWPDTIAATGMAGAQGLTGLLGAACRLTYHRAAAVVAQSSGMAAALEQRGVPQGRLAIIHNWALEEAPPLANIAPQNGSFRVVYAGNLGKAQQLETVIEAAALLARDDHPIEFLFYGDGVEAASLQTQAAGLVHVHFMGRVPHAAMPEILARADALLIHLADHPLFAITIPSKLQACLAAGRPILAGIAGEPAAILETSGAAKVVPPGDATALAGAAKHLASLSPARRAAMGAAGRAHYESQFSFAAGMDRTIRLLRDTEAMMQHHDPLP
jgi:glycosyltransferase involved in cell wall biosynthesis